MPNFFEIPLTADPQTFGITLGAVDYNLTLKYCDVGGAGWVLDIADFNNNPLVSGIALVTGTDLLEQYAYLGFAGRLWVQSGADPDAVPTYENLGTGSHLYWVTDQ